MRLISMDCAICGRKGKIVYEDADLIAILPDSGARDGHIALSAKKHISIVSQIPDELVARMFLIANKLALSLSEISGSFNIIANNEAGEDFHFALNIIPREVTDGINFQWQPKQMQEDALNKIHETLKNMPLAPIDEKKPEKKSEERKESLEEKDGEENYMLDQLRRVP